MRYRGGILSGRCMLEEGWPHPRLVMQRQGKGSRIVLSLGRVKDRQDQGADRRHNQAEHLEELDPHCGSVRLSRRVGVTF